MIHSKTGGGGGGFTAPSSPPPQLKNSHHKVMLTREPTSKLNSCIIPWFAL